MAITLHYCGGVEYSEILLRGVFYVIVVPESALETSLSLRDDFLHMHGNVC